MSDSSPTLMFAGPFLIDPPQFWRVEWAGDIEGTLGYLGMAGHPRPVWRPTRQRENIVPRDVHDEDRLPQAIRVHGYDHEDETCYCVSMNAESKADITHMSMVEHSYHVADVIRGLT